MGNLSARVHAGKWREVVPSEFPDVPPLALEMAREAAFDTRIEYIGTQISQLAQLIEVFSERPDIQEIANGRRLEFENEVADIIKARYPETKPLPLTKQEETDLLLNRDTNAAIQFFVGLGEIDALDPKIFPALKHLKQETLLELKIDALLAKLARYKEWQAAETDDKYGFRLNKESPSGASNLHNVSETLIKQTVAQIERLADERRELLDLVN